LKKIRLYTTGLIVTLIIISGCSTEKNTFVNRTYHNVTAHYNVYFNGKEAYRKGMARIENQHIDDFTRLLPIYITGTEETASAIAGEMDKAIKKASKTIKYHSIKAKPKPKDGKLSKKEQRFMKRNEYNNWVDDSYLLMGKAYFMKMEFIPARQNFEYLIREFREEEIKYDAMFWMGRTALATGNLKMTREWLDQIEAEKDFPERLIADVEVLEAAYYLTQGDTEAAMPHLHKSIKENKNKYERVRHQYLLAQLYKEKEDFRKAAEIFEEIHKGNAPYEMEFNAKINMAECYGKLGGSYKDMKKLLSKMIKDDKNIEYLDQVYYALAEVEYKNGQKEKAIKNYKLSSESSLENMNQKAISCMKLGNIYFEEPDYRNSQAYYDTCIMNLSNQHTKYDEIRTLSRNLNGLITNMDIVETQDSLQRLAAMSEKERNDLIDNIIKEVIAQEEREKELERERQQNSMLFDQRRGSSQTNAPTGGKWYFYNPATISFGQNEFRKKWGNRKLEDHWRRSNKSVMTEDMLDAEQNQASDSNAVARITNNKSREFYLQDIPLNDSLMLLSNEKIREALFDLGNIYYRDFNDTDRAIASFENLNNRFPDHEYKLPTYYGLYELYQSKNNVSEAQKYKQQIINQFPESHYAKLLQNPNYLKELADKQENERILYEEMYDLYRENNLNIAEQKSQAFIENYPNSIYVPKVKFIQIISSALDVDQIQFKQNLASFIQTYPNDALSNRAALILGYLGETDVESLIADLDSRPDVIKPTDTDSISDRTNPIEESIYLYNPDTAHYYVIAVMGTDIDIKKLNFEVSSFNIFTFNMRTFRVNNHLFSDKLELVSVKPFKNQKQAVNYMKLIENNDVVFDVLKQQRYEQFVISESNFELMQKEKEIDDYLKFYNTNYNKP
jgi:TolA-binding protein